MSVDFHIPLLRLNIFLLPGEQIPLHIVEERYKQLLEEAESQGQQFGLPYEDKRLKRHLVSICSLLRVTKRYESGALDIVVEAQSVGRLLHFEETVRGKLYPGGNVEEMDLHLDEPADEELLTMFMEYIRLKFGNELPLASVSKFKVMDVAASVALSNHDKAVFLGLPDQGARLYKLKQNLRYLNLLQAQEKSFEHGFIMN